MEGLTVVAFVVFVLAYIVRVGVFTTGRSLAMAGLTVIGVVGFVLLNVVWMWRQYDVWRRDFAGRKRRCHGDCPSNKALPRTSKTYAERVSSAGKTASRVSFKRGESVDLVMQAKLLHAATEDEDDDITGALSFGSVGTMPQSHNPVMMTAQESMCTKFENVSRARTNSKMEQMAIARGDSTPVMRADGQQVLTKASGIRAEYLHFDHVYITWWQFLWGSYFVSGPAALAVVFGVAAVTFRGWLVRKGLWRQVPYTPARVVGNLLLETMQAVHYVGTLTKDSKQIAEFVWVDLPFLDKEGAIATMPQLLVEVDLDTKCMVKAIANMPEKGKSSKDVTLAAHQVVSLISFNIVGSDHVKSHCGANWGLDVESPDPYVRQNSVVSVIYNYFGRSGYVQVQSRLYRWGLMSGDWTGFGDAITVGEKQGFVPHKKVVELKLHSDLVCFVIEARRIFLKCFEAFAEQLPDIDGEAMFIGTVIHSLDHTTFCRAIRDPLWFNADDPLFGPMNDVLRMVRAGFTDDLPVVCFTKRYKSARHPFYQAFYQSAKNINKDLADTLDTCIIK